MSWLGVANCFPDNGLFNAQPGDCHDRTVTNGFTLMDEVDLDRFEEDLTLIRIVGSVFFRCIKYQEAGIEVADWCRIRWGLLKEQSDESGFVAPIDIFDPLALELPWMTVREYLTPSPQLQTTPEGRLWDGWAIRQADVDITVKRKLSTFDQLTLWYGAALGTAGHAIAVNIETLAHIELRMLIKHD